jgi:hypothetical protein
MTHRCGSSNRVAIEEIVLRRPVGAVVRGPRVGGTLNTRALKGESRVPPAVTNRKFKILNRTRDREVCKSFVVRMRGSITKGGDPAHRVEFMTTAMGMQPV